MINNCINQIIIAENIRHILNLEYRYIHAPQVLFVLYLDLHLKMEIWGRLRMNFYNQRDALNFTIANYLHIRSNIPTSSVYKVYISVDTIFKSFWFLNRLVAANKKVTESMVLI